MASLPFTVALHLLLVLSLQCGWKENMWSAFACSNLSAPQWSNIASPSPSSFPLSSSPLGISIALVQFTAATTTFSLAAVTEDPFILKTDLEVTASDVSPPVFELRQSYRYSLPSSCGAIIEGTSDLLLVSIIPVTFKAVFPRLVDRTPLFASLHTLSTALCAPVLVHVLMPIVSWKSVFSSLGRSSGLVSDDILYLHSLLHELPAFVQHIAATSPADLQLLIQSFHVPPLQVVALSSSLAEVDASHTIQSYIRRLHWLATRGDDNGRLQCGQRVGNYSLTPLSLQQRHVEALIFSMKPHRHLLVASQMCRDDIVALHSFDAVSVVSHQQQRETHTSASYPSVETKPGIEEQTVDAIAVCGLQLQPYLSSFPVKLLSSLLLLASHSVHVTAGYSWMPDGSGNVVCATQSMTIVTGPIQQVVELYRDIDVGQLVVVVDGVRLTAPCIWRLLNGGNLSIFLTTPTASSPYNHTIVEMQLEYERHFADTSGSAFAFHLRVSGAVAKTSFAPALFDSVTLTSFLLHRLAIGALVDGYRPQYRQEISQHGRRKTEPIHSAVDAAGAIVEPNFALIPALFSVQGLSLFSYPLLPSSALPIASVSFSQLSPWSPGYAIPRVIHQTWFDPVSPPWLSIGSWRQSYLEACDGWLHLLWDRNSVLHVPMLDRWLWDLHRSQNGRSHISRAAILRSYGGTYVDADIPSLESGVLDGWYAAANDTGSFVVTEEKARTCESSRLFGTRPQHPIMTALQEWQHELTADDRGSAQWEKKGPDDLARACASCLSAPSDCSVAVVSLSSLCMDGPNVP
jgi:hypothetical protein